MLLGAQRPPGAVPFEEGAAGGRVGAIVDVEVRAVGVAAYAVQEESADRHQIAHHLMSRVGGGEVYVEGRCRSQLHARGTNITCNIKNALKRVLILIS